MSAGAPRMDYDAVAGGYDRRYEVNDFTGVERALLAFADGVPARGILEVGCGTGHWLRLLARRGAGRPAGLDPSAGMLSRAGGDDLPLARGRAEALPFRAASFQRIFCINALHHFDDPAAFFAEARRALRPGGAVMVVGLDPHTGRDRWAIYDFFEGTREADARRYPPAAAIRRWMAGAGFCRAVTHEVQRLPLSLPAREALEAGRLARGTTSQLAMLSEPAYERGIARIRERIEAGEARGEPFHLISDLTLYATYGSLTYGGGGPDAVLPQAG